MDKLRQGLPAAVPAISMNRYWFYPGEERYVTDEGIVMIESCPIELLAERQFVATLGGKGKEVDSTAAEFARNFTTRYREIARQRPVFQELENLFRFVSLARVMRWEDAPTVAGLDLKYLTQEHETPETPVDTTLAGRFNVKRLVYEREEDGIYFTTRKWFTSCGGIAMAIEVKEEDFGPDETGRLGRIRQLVLNSRPSANAVSWKIRP
jgi:hypothetical protein